MLGGSPRGVWDAHHHAGQQVTSGLALPYRARCDVVGGQGDPSNQMTTSAALGASRAALAPFSLSRQWVPRYPWQWEDASPPLPPLRAAAASASSGDGGTGAMLSGGDPRLEETSFPTSRCKRCSTWSQAGVSRKAGIPFPPFIAVFPSPSTRGCPHCRGE